MREWGLVRWSQAVAVVPLTALSGLWTTHLVAGGTDAPDDAALPDGVAVPSEAIEAPASYSRPGRLGLGVRKGSAAHVAATASTNGIPSGALSAYQRAETVMHSADRACDVDWELVAAIGRVESDHGRYGGNTLGTDGVSRPGIYGIALDGTQGTAEIADTDAGRFDRDTVYDRAVGPMQFIPSTWAEVGVDADGDGRRNPQDVDDAALASAVYLCSGATRRVEGDLGTDAGRRTAVYRYNHSRAYVDLVLSVRDAYLDGDYAAVPNHVTSAMTLTADHDYYPGPTVGTEHATSTTPAAGGGTRAPAAAAPSAEEPATAPAPEPTGTDEPVDQLEKAVKKTVAGATGAVDATVEAVLSLPQAVLACTAQGLTALTTPVEWNACIHRNTH